MAMTSLSYAHQVTKPNIYKDEVPKIEVTPHELKLVKTLIDGTTARVFDFSKYTDTSKCAESIDTSIAFMDALKQSVAEQTEARPGKKLAPSKLAPSAAKQKKTSWRKRRGITRWNCCKTNTLPSRAKLVLMTKGEAVQHDSHLRRRICRAGSTLDTAMLIVGQGSSPLQRNGQISKTLREAERLQKRCGVAITILGESGFLEQLGSVQSIRRLYTLAQLIELTGTKRGRFRGWDSSGFDCPGRNGRRASATSIFARS